MKMNWTKMQMSSKLIKLENKVGMKIIILWLTAKISNYPASECDKTD